MVCEKYNPSLLFNGSRKSVDPQIGIFLSPLNTNDGLCLTHISVDLPAHEKDIRKKAAHWHQTFMHTHTPTHNLRLWPKRPPLAFSVAEMSVTDLVCICPTRRKLCSCWLTLSLQFLRCLLIIFGKRTDQITPAVWSDLNPICLTP